MRGLRGKHRSSRTTEGPSFCAIELQIFILQSSTSFISKVLCRVVWGRGWLSAGLAHKEHSWITHFDVFGAAAQQRAVSAPHQDYQAITLKWWADHLQWSTPQSTYMVRQRHELEE